MYDLSAFKAYDIRGEVPAQLNSELAYLIGRAYASEFNPKTIVIGHDIRLESPELSDALCKGLTESGVEVWHLGLCGTEEVYFATSHYQADGGVMITASHNPKGNNGLKLIKAESRPISKETGLLELKKRIENNDFSPLADKPAKVVSRPDKSAYIQKLLSYIDLKSIKPFKIVVNGGNGAVGPTFDELAKHLPCEFIRINHQPDGNFPNGVPNPMIPGNRQQTSQAILDHKADFAVAWDGDFDRCFLYDEKGQFIEGYYMVGLLAETLLQSNPGAKIIYEPRLTWNTIEQIEKAGGEAILGRTGHSFIKDHMREIGAIYAGEITAHHYFKDFFYCDSGMIPWLLVMQLLSTCNQPLSQLVDEHIQAHPCSGEINFKVNKSAQIISAVKEHYSEQNPLIIETDGISLEFPKWRLNMRTSNTEPLLRLNVESRGDKILVEKIVKEVSAIIKRIG